MANFPGLTGAESRRIPGPRIGFDTLRGIEMSSSNDAFRSVATSDLIFGSHAAVYALDRLVQEHETVDERSAAQGLATAARILFDALADRLIERNSLNDDDDNDDNDDDDNDDDNDDNDDD